MQTDNEITLSYNKTIEILKSSNEDLKPFAILNLNEVKSDDFELVIGHLTNCDGRIREVVSMKLLELEGLKEKHFEKIIDALCDVNPNVSRNIVELIRVKKLDLFDGLVKRIGRILDEIEAMSRPKKWKTQKNHLLNKKFFKLYWCLEGLLVCFREDEELARILRISADFDDYTIREKAAKIVAQMENPPDDLVLKLQNDENFYVRNAFVV